MAVQVSVNVYSINQNSNNVPVRMGFPASRAVFMGVKCTLPNSNVVADFQPVTVGSTTVNCYARVLVGTDSYLVQETPASLVTLSNQ